MPKLPKHLSKAQYNSNRGHSNAASGLKKISANELEVKKNLRFAMVVNQTLIGMTDIFIKQKYFEYLKAQDIVIVSNIFERMDLDRKINERLAKLKQQLILTDE